MLGAAGNKDGNGAKVGLTGFVTSRKTTLDFPPPGEGLVTVIEAVPGEAMLAAGTTAVNCAALT
jgi:hypothetical protein